MNIRSFLSGLFLCACAGVVSAGDGRDPSDIMSYYLSSKMPPSGALRSSPGLDSVTAEQCQSGPFQSNGPALVFNDVGLLATRFPLSKTLAAIISSSPQTSTGTVALMQSMLDSYTATQQTNPVGPQLIMPVDFRFGESTLNSSALVNSGGMIPVALFNRFDLANKDGLNCGEYRMVYAMDNIAAGSSGRFFIIFEAQYPNPLPAEGINGCASIADFWASLDDSALTNSQRADLLANFFYDGVVHNSVPLAPVVTFDNYSATGGQVRTNNFIDFNWQLREFRTAVSGSKVVFSVDTNKDDPLTEFYSFNAASPPSFPLDQDKFNILGQAFQDEFVATYIRNLALPEANSNGNPLSATDVINGITLATDNQFNEFQSNAMGLDDIPQPNPFSQIARPDPAFVSRVSNTPRFGLTASQVFNRAGAMTCGGCHEFSNGVPISSTVNWPVSAGFVHVKETGALSQALTGSFLPKREELLREFVCGNIVVDDAEHFDWLVPIIRHMSF